MIAAAFDELNGSPARVELHGPLGEEYGREHLLYVSSPGEAIRALCSQYKGFREAISRPGACYSVLVGGMDGANSLPLEAVNMQSGSQDIHLVPIVEGAGNSQQWGMVIMGAALMGAAFLTAGAAVPAMGTLSGAVWSMGMGMGLMGLAQIIAPAQQPKVGAAERSDLFSGPANTVAQGHPIQICYGEIEVGSAVVASMIDYSGAATALPAEPATDGEEGYTSSGILPVNDSYSGGWLLQGPDGWLLKGDDGNHVPCWVGHAPDGTVCVYIGGDVSIQQGGAWYLLGPDGCLLQNNDGSYVRYKGE